MIIDIHAHIWAGRYEQNKEEIIKACEKHNIAKVYVSALRDQYSSEETVDELNLNVDKFIREYPDKIGGFCYINPVNSNAIYVLKKGIEQQSMEGMKLWIATYCDDERVYPLVEQCIEYDIPILIHAFHKAVGQLNDESLGIHVANLAERYPDAKLLMAHLGGNAYDGIKPIVKHKNIYVDISGSLFRRDELDYTKKLIGAERILFGTDMPGASFYANYGQVVDADLTEEERELVLCKNALKLLKRHR